MKFTEIQKSAVISTSHVTLNDSVLLELAAKREATPPNLPIVYVKHPDMKVGKPAQKPKAKRAKKIKTFLLAGDIVKAGRVTASGATFEEAIRNAESGGFSIYEEDEHNMGFNFCGDTDGGVEEV